jgi:hypothetical protein
MESDDPWLTGACCINPDQTGAGAQIGAVLEAAGELQRNYEADAGTATGQR